MLLNLFSHLETFYISLCLPDKVHPFTWHVTSFLRNGTSQRWYYWHFGLDKFVEGAVPCAVGYLAASQASTHEMPVAISTQLWQPKISPHIAKSRLSGKSFLVEKHCSKASHLLLPTVACPLCISTHSELAHLPTVHTPCLHSLCLHTLSISSPRTFAYSIPLFEAPFPSSPNSVNLKSYSFFKTKVIDYDRLLDFLLPETLNVCSLNSPCYSVDNSRNLILCFHLTPWV